MLFPAAAEGWYSQVKYLKQQLQDERNQSQQERDAHTAGTVSGQLHHCLLQNMAGKMQMVHASKAHSPVTRPL